MLLGRSGDIRARRPLERALLDPHYAVRAAAVRALANLGDVRAVPSILDLLGDDEPFVRLEARRMLERFPLEDARPYLIHALRRHADERVRLASAERLAEGATPEVVEVLLDATADVDQVARFATSVLSALPEEHAVTTFLGGLQHPDYRVQIASLRTLADMGVPRAVEPIVAMLDSRVPEVTLAAAQALRSLAEHIDRQRFVVAALRAKDRFERARAFKVLGVLGGEEAARLLLNAMDDPDVLVRGAAVAGSHNLGDIRAIPKLEEMKKHEENARIRTLVRTTLAALVKLRDGDKSP